MDISVVVNQVLMLFLPIVIGYFIIKIKLVDEGFKKNISAFLFNVTLPCTIISALQFDFEPSMIIKSGMLILISLVILFIMWLSGLSTTKLLRMNDQSRNVAIYSLMFSNFSFMGYPVAQAFLGDKGMFYATMFSIPMYAIVQSFGVALIVGGGSSKKFRLSYILNAPMVAVVIGFVMFLTGWRLPKAVDGTIRSIGAMTTPLSMILVGLALSVKPLKNAFTDYRYYIVALLRLVVMPLIIFYLLRLINIDIDICRISAIITMMPVAANIIMTSAAFGKDTSDPAKSVLLTTLLSVITIPLVGFLLF